jgi:uncharacterized damage-inducible protein DinB
MTSNDVQILIDYNYWLHDIASLTSAWRDIETQMRACFAPLDDRALERVLDYKSAAGASVSCHMLQHVVNHSTYHRGQVTTMQRQSGATPPEAMDLNGFYRERTTPAA